METKKINLKEFKKESLQIKKLLEAKGGSGCSNQGTVQCRTCSVGGNADYRACDSDVQW